MANHNDSPTHGASAVAPAITLFSTGGTNSSAVGGAVKFANPAAPKLVKAAWWPQPWGSLKYSVISSWFLKSLLLQVVTTCCRYRAGQPPTKTTGGSAAGGRGAPAAGGYGPLDETVMTVRRRQSSVRPTLPLPPQKLR